MDSLRCSLAVLAACLASLALTSSASAAITLTNPGFETGTTAGWEGQRIRDVELRGLLRAVGVVLRPRALPRLSRASISSRPSPPTAGDLLSGWAFFRTGDYLPFDDEGDVSIVVTASGSSTILFSSSVSEVGGSGGTPWKGFAFVMPETGEYVLRCASRTPSTAARRAPSGSTCRRARSTPTATASRTPPTTAPSVANTDQRDNDADRRGDACDGDDDGDGVADSADNCALAANPGQVDDDFDGHGDACDDVLDSTAGFASGGGWLMAAGATKVNFSISATSADGDLAGSCTIVAGRTKLTCVDATGYVRAPSGAVVVRGHGTIGGELTGYRIVVQDAGEPGRGVDRFEITTDAGFSAAGVIGGGNIQTR